MLMWAGWWEEGALEGLDPLRETAAMEIQAGAQVWGEEGEGGGTVNHRKWSWKTKTGGTAETRGGRRKSEVRLLSRSRWGRERLSGNVGKCVRDGWERRTGLRSLPSQGGRAGTDTPSLCS